MSSLTQSDLRVITKIVQVLRQDHGLQLEYQDPSLGQKICAKVSEANDPVLTALWNTLSTGFRADAVPSKVPDSTKLNTKVSRLYRGQKIGGASDAKENTQQKNELNASSDEQPQAENSEDRTNGHYVTYRGKKKWVEH